MSVISQLRWQWGVYFRLFQWQKWPLRKFLIQSSVPALLICQVCDVCWATTLVLKAWRIKTVASCSDSSRTPLHCFAVCDGFSSIAFTIIVLELVSNKVDDASSVEMGQPELFVCVFFFVIATCQQDLYWSVHRNTCSLIHPAACSQSYSLIWDVFTSRSSLCFFKMLFSS